MEPLNNVDVVAAVIESKGLALCVRRGIHALPYISGKWEFPGGKLELGESHASALEREIAEELHVRVEVGPHLITVRHNYLDFRLTMHAYRCVIADPVDAVVLAEHVELQWLRPTDSAFADLDWAAADMPVVEVLRGGAV